MDTQECYLKDCGCVREDYNYEGAEIRALLDVKTIQDCLEVIMAYIRKLDMVYIWKLVEIVTCRKLNTFHSGRFSSSPKVRRVINFSTSVDHVI